jgi:hypothetical protein
VSIAPLFKAIPGVVKFRVIPTNAVVVESITSTSVYVKGRLYVNIKDLPANYWYDAEKFEKDFRNTFKDVAHVVFVLSDKLYALVFFQGDGEVEIVAYDVERALEKS